MEKGAIQKEIFFTLEWTIKNFTCWNRELHSESIKCISRMIPGIEIVLYPRTMNGNGKRLEVLLINKNTGICGEVLIFLPGGKPWIRQIESPKDKYVVLDDGPKYTSVVHRISEKGDEVVLQYRMKSSIDTVERVRTTICMHHKYFQLTSTELDDLGSTEKNLGPPIEWKLDNGTEESMELQGVQDSQHRSKICLLLVPTCLTKSVFVQLQSVPKENMLQHTFRTVSDKWKLATLTKEDTSGKGLLFYCAKFVPCISPELSYPPELPNDIDANRLMADASSVSDPWETWKSLYIEYSNILKHQYLDHKNWRQLVDLHSEAVRLGITDLAQQIVDTLSSNMPDALVLAIRHKNLTLLGEVHEFFVGNRQQVLSTPQWTNLTNVDPRLAEMFLKFFGQG